MGQGQSSKRKGQTEVKWRNRDGPRPERPSSYPVQGTSYPVSTDLLGGGEFSLRRAGSADLTGTRIVAYPQNPDIITNPIATDTIANQMDYDTISNHSNEAPEIPTIVEQRSRKSNPKANARAAYQQSLETVLGIWPEYEPLKEFKANKNQFSLQDTLQQVYKRLCEQHTSIGKMYRQNHDIRQQIQTMKTDLETQEAVIKDKDKELDECLGDIGFLRGELKRRGFDPKIPGKDRGGSEHTQHSLIKEVEVFHQHSRVPSDSNSDIIHEESENDFAQRFKKRKESGQLLATPLLLAEGRDALNVAIKRQLSLKSTQPPPSNKSSSSVDSGVSRSHESNKLIEELNEKVRRLQASLEEERRENDILLKRLDDEGYESKSPRSPRTPEYTSSRESTEQLIDDYAELEAEGMYKVMSLIGRLLTHVRDQRKQQFICAVMEKCYEHASWHIHKFHKNMKELLMHPLELEYDSHSAGPYNGNSSRFTYPEPRLGRKLASQKSVPISLFGEITSYLETTADQVRLTALVQNAIDELCDEFSDCTTASLLNHNGFNHFIYDCARLTWKMVLLNPPVSIATDLGRGYDKNIHMIASSDILHPSTGHPIDYYVWPVLHTRRHHDVLHKGRVILKRDR